MYKMLLPTIAIILVASLFYSGDLFRTEQSKFCNQNGFQRQENFDNSHACKTDTGTKIIMQKMQCNLDIIAMFTFQNPYKGCKLIEEKK